MSGINIINYFNTQNITYHLPKARAISGVIFAVSALAICLILAQANGNFSSLLSKHSAAFLTFSTLGLSSFVAFAISIAMRGKRVEISNEIQQQPIDYVRLYREAIELYSQSVEILKTDQPWQIRSEIAERIHQRQQEIINKIKSPDILFKIFKTICFGNEMNFALIPELTISDEQMEFGDKALIANDGSFLFGADKMPFRIMRGYNPKLQIHFIAIKGIILIGDNKCIPSVQIFHQVASLKKFKRLKGSWWNTNGDREVVFKRDIMEQFIGGRTEQTASIIGGFTFDEWKNLMNLKVFIDAPKIMESAKILLSNGLLLPPLASLVIDYYSFEA